MAGHDGQAQWEGRLPRWNASVRSLVFIQMAVGSHGRIVSGRVQSACENLPFHVEDEGWGREPAVMVPVRTEGAWTKTSGPQMSIESLLFARYH